MKRFGILALAALAACADVPSSPLSAPPDPRSIVVNGASAVGAYQRVPDVLSVYDRRPEVGISALPGNWPQVTAAGMRLVRATIYYDPAASPVQHPTLAYLVNAAAASGVELLVVVHNTALCRENAGADPYGDYARWVAQLAADFPSVRYWELWNEQDHPGSTNFFGGSAKGCVKGRATVTQQGVQYAALLQEAYPLIKAANPDAWVLIGGLTGYEGWNFLHGIYQGGGRAFYDFIAVHAYGDSPAAMYSHPDAVDEVLEIYEDTGRPLWLTEFGAGAANYPGADPPIPSYHDSTAVDSTAYNEHQRLWWSNTLDVAAADKRYARLVGYHLFTTDSAFWPPVGARVANRADFGASLLYMDGTPRPSYTHLVQRQFNAAVFAHPTRTVNIDVEIPGWVPRDHAWSPLAGGRIRIHNVTVSHAGSTDVPLVPEPWGSGW